MSFWRDVRCMLAFQPLERPVEPTATDEAEPWLQDILAAKDLLEDAEHAVALAQDLLAEALRRAAEG